MSDDRWHTVLVLGGIRSGKSAFAEALVADAPAVRYVATAAGGEDDPEWLARIEEHQRRRPQSWSTEETGADPARLAELLAEAKPDDTLLVDDLGGWATALLDPARQPNDDQAEVAALAAAVRGCAARVVLVSPEVGLSVVPATPVGRAFADAMGTTNQALAQACDRVALVVAGQAVWLKPTTTARPAGPAEPRPVGAAVPQPAGPAEPQPVTPAEPFLVTPAEPLMVTPAEPARVTPAQPFLVTPAAEQSTATPPVVEPPSGVEPAPGGLDEPTMILPLVASGTAIEPGMDLPLPDADAGPDARDRLATVDFAGAGLGALGEVVEFAAATQVTTTPRPWSAPRVLLISGSHAGGAAAGDDPAEVERRLAEVENGTGVLVRLAGEAGADVAMLRVASVAAMEDGPVLDEAAVETLLRQGWQLADAAADDGRDVLVIASIGTGTDAVATAVVSATTGAEAVTLLPRVLKPGGFYDDNAWMLRCAAVRDALHRIRQEPRGAKDLLRELGGTDFAVVVGALLGAAARRLPVLLDGPVGVAAAVIARDLASQIRHWCLLPEAGTLELVRQGADVLGVAHVFKLGLSLGEGANALAALPLLRTAIGLAAVTPLHPALLDEPVEDEPVEDGLADFVVPDDEDNQDGAHAGNRADAENRAGSANGADAENGEFAEPEPDGPGPATTGA